MKCDICLSDMVWLRDDRDGDSITSTYYCPKCGYTKEVESGD